MILLVVGSAHGILRGGSYEEGQELERVSRHLGKDKNVAVPAPAPGVAPAKAPGGAGGNKQGGGGGGGGGTDTTVTVVIACGGTDTIVSTDSATGLTKTISACGVAEQRPCLNPNKVVQSAIDNQQTSLACRFGTCVGCCRYFNYLFCDTQNSFPHLPCLCNEYTYGGNPFAASGSTVASTSTSAATSSTRDGAIPAAPEVVDPDEDGCTAAWRGQGLGQKPLTVPDGFPSFLAPGECLNSGHCVGTEGGCCKFSDVVESSREEPFFLYPLLEP